MLTYIVDEDEVSLFLTEQVLQAAGFSTNTQTFASAEETLAYLPLHQHMALPRVIFLDLNMPLVDGWEVLEQLAPHEPELRGRCAIYLLTSSLAQTDINRSKSYALVAGLLHKPLTDEHLHEIRAQLGPEG
jgi:CheY-like chemotaxis protein